MCGSCCFYQPHPWGGDGTCRRNPPFIDGWPHTLPTEWCAEWYGGEPDANDAKPEVVN